MLHRLTLAVTFSAWACSPAAGPAQSAPDAQPGDAGLSPMDAAPTDAAPTAPDTGTAPLASSPHSPAVERYGGDGVDDAPEGGPSRYWQVGITPSEHRGGSFPLDCRRISVTAGQCWGCG